MKGGGRRREVECEDFIQKGEGRIIRNPSPLSHWVE